MIGREARHHAARAEHALGIIGRRAHLLRLRVAFALARKGLVEPAAIEILDQRPIENVGPDHRLAILVAVIVPGAGGREDEVAAFRDAALALDRGVAALRRQDGAAGVGRVAMDRRHVARIVDRDGAADDARHLQPAAQARIGEEELLPVGELYGRHVGGLGDLGDAREIGRDVAPAPQPRHRLHLPRRDPARGERRVPPRCRNRGTTGAAPARSPRS